MFTAVLEDNISCRVHEHSINTGKRTNGIFTAFVSMTREEFLFHLEGEEWKEEGGKEEEGRPRRDRERIGERRDV